MEVVVRTPHGEAELIVRAIGSDLTLDDLLERVTGQPSPPVVSVDGRSVPTTGAVGACGIAAGSVLSTLEARTSPAEGTITIVQVAGTGAGTRVALAPGEYRIGPGRRVAAPELDFAPVDESVIDLTVQQDRALTVAGVGRPIRLDGRRYPTGEVRPWTDGLLEVADRVFELADDDPDPRPDIVRTVNHSGRTPFNRPPRRIAPDEGDPGPLPHLAESLHTAMRDRRSLWQRRAHDPHAFTIPVGLAGGDDRDDDWDDDGDRALAVATVDLSTERGIGIVGGSDFTRAATRGFLLAATTAFGPADLDLAILTSPERLPVWEWTKWLPHTTLLDDPQLLGDEAGIAHWIRSRGFAGADPSGDDAVRPAVPDHLTLIVVDEAAWWHDRASPLRTLFTASGAPVRFLVLGATPEEVPAVCTTVLEERPGRGATLERFLTGEPTRLVHPFLPDEAIAVETARNLAPFDDPEISPPIADPLPDRLSLERLLELDGAESSTIAARWFAARDAATGSTPIGRTADRVVECALDDGGLELLVVGGPDTGTGAVLEGLAIGLAAHRQPADVNLMCFDLSGRDTFEACRRLPHVVGDLVDPSTTAMRRMVRALHAEVERRRRLLTTHGVETWHEYRRVRDAPTLPCLVLFVDEATPAVAERSAFVASLVDIVTAGGRFGMHLFAATRRPRSLDRSIAVAARRTLTFRTDAGAGLGGDTGGGTDTDAAVASTDAETTLPRFRPGRAVLRDTSGSTVVQTVTSYGPELGARSPYAVTPFVVGRDATAMERRVARTNRLAPDRADDPRLFSAIEIIRAAAAELGQERQHRPCPEPLPEELSLSEMLDAFPGDGVPFALEDRPDDQLQPPCWWQPGPRGGLAVYGGSESDRRGLLVALALGIAQRASADDVHLYVIGDRTSESLAALDELPHTGAVIGLDESSRLEALVQHLDDEITRRADLAEQRGGPPRVAGSEPAVALLVAGVGTLRQQLRRHSDGDGILLDLERAIRDGEQYGMCAVLTVHAPRLLPRALSDGLDRIVFPLDDPDELAVFGLGASDVPSDVAGRAVRPEGPTEIQLASPPDDVASTIAGLHLEPAVERPPHIIATTDGQGRPS